MKVWPKDDATRKLFTKHPHPSGVGFHEEGPSEWPDDQFTTRRLRDGDVTLAEPKAENKEPSRKTVKEQ